MPGSFSPAYGASTLRKVLDMAPKPWTTESCPLRIAAAGNRQGYGTLNPSVESVIAYVECQGPDGPLNPSVES